MQIFSINVHRRKKRSYENLSPNEYHIQNNFNPERRATTQGSNCQRYELLFAFGMELYESSRRSGRRSSQRRRRTNETKNKPNNPNFEGCGKLWQSLGMWAVICIWRTIPGGLMSVETESCEYSTLSFAFGMDPSCYDRPPSLGDPAVGVRMDIVCLVLCCMLLQLLFVGCLCFDWCPPFYVLLRAIPTSWGSSCRRQGLPVHLAWSSYESSKRSGRRNKRTRKM